MSGPSTLTDDNASALARLETRVDGIAGDVGDLTRTVDRFVEKTDERFEKTDAKSSESMIRVDEKLTAILLAARNDEMRLPAAAPAASPSTGDWIRSNLATIAVAAIGGFLAYVNTNIQSSVNDLKQASHDSNAAIVALSNATTKSFGDMGTATYKEIKEATAGAIPRPELDIHFTKNEAMIASKVNADVLAAELRRIDGSAAQMHEEIETLKKHSETDSRFSDLVKRLDINAGRIEDVQKASASIAVVLEQQRELNTRVGAVESRLLGSPKYLVHPNGD